MEKTNFLITDAAKQVKVENHVLRYWEEELGLPIGRNEMGHRYYTEEDIQKFIEVKKLKDQGIQLKAIRTMLQGEKREFGVAKFTVHPADINVVPGSTNMETDVSSVVSDSQNSKMLRLQELLKQLIGETVKENTKEIYEEMKDNILKEIDYQFRAQEEQEEKRETERRMREEEHYKKIDELLRNKSQRKKHSIF